MSDQTVLPAPSRTTAPAAARAPRGRRRGPMGGRALPWLAPSLLVLLAVSLFPQIYALVNSFRFFNLGVALDPRGYVGFDNFSHALSDGTFTGAFARTILFAGVCTAVELALGIAIAVLLSQGLRGTSVARAVLIMPVAIAPAVAGLAFRSMYAPDTGLIPNLLSAVGIGTPESGILGSTHTALIALMVTEVWQWTPFAALIVLAAMQGVPGDVIEAARLDGASSWRVLRSVTLPLIAGSLAAVTVLRFIQSFNVFDIVYVQTRGGPGTSTTTLGLDIYLTGLSDYNIGLASAMTWLATLAVGVLINVYLLVSARRAR